MKARSQHPIDSIVVEADGQIVVASNGQVSGPHELVKKITINATVRERYQLTYPHGEFVEARLNPDDPVATTAALVSAAPGRAKILEAPSAVWVFIDSDMEDNAEGYVEAMVAQTQDPDAPEHIREEA